jgi:hypothetical protein
MAGGLTNGSTRSNQPFALELIENNDKILDKVVLG